MRRAVAQYFLAANLAAFCIFCVIFITYLPLASPFYYGIPLALAVPAVLFLFLPTQWRSKVFPSELEAAKLVHSAGHQVEALEASMDGIAILDKNEQYIFVNHAHAEIYGYDSPRDLLGKSWHVLYAPEELTRFKTELMPDFMRLGKLRVEAIGKRKDGSFFPQEVSLTALKGVGLICVVRDISERRRAQDDAEEKALFVNLNPAPVMRISESGEVLMANPSAKKVFGLADERGIKIFDLVPEIAHLDIGACIRSEGHFSFTSTVRDRFYRFTMGGVPKRGFAHIYGADITDLKRAEEKLLHAQKMEAVGLLAGGVAHDFNNLLTGIMGYTTLLKMELHDNSEMQHAAHMIEITAEKAAELTKQLLAFARKGKLQNIPVNMHSTIEESLSILHRTIEKNISIALDLAAPHPWVTGDPGQIQQVIMNLAINARDAMTKDLSGSDGGELRIITRQITVRDRTETHDGVLDPGDYLELAISDTGCGMEMGLKERIFEPFFTTKSQARGSGMGLAVVYGIVKNHGGSIGVHSVKDCGTTFTITLPLAQRELVRPSEKKSAVRTGQGKILIVDDHYVIRDVTSRMLSTLGYESVLARDGLEAIQIYRQNQGKFDVVILDLVMPNMNAQDCLELLRSVNKDVRVIISSGYDTNNSMQGILNEQGVFAFLQKPFQLSQLSEVVEAVIKGIRIV